MRTRKTAMRLVLCAVLFSLVLGLAAAGCAESPVQCSERDIKLIEQCEAAFDGNTLTVTDTDDNNDVWSSKLLLDTGMELTPGEQYTVSFSLAGEHGVGEFFLCKSENIDERYDETFAAEGGDRSISFIAAQNRVYIGMQVGNLGKGNCVTATLSNLSALSESANPSLLRTENGTVSVTENSVTATDTHDNNDVWNSKLLFNTGIPMEVGKSYKLSFTLDGDHGVGEFFVCKSQNLNDRDDSTFVNQAGSNTVVFNACSDVLYIGMQFGNLGAGNSVTFTLEELREVRKAEGTDRPKPAVPAVLISKNCSYEMESSGSQTTITGVDTSPEEDVWTSSLLVYLGELLEENSVYAANFNLAGGNDDGKFGEFFFCKEDDLEKRYSFNDTPGDHTAQFKAEDNDLYAGMQFGNLGEGNEMTVTIQDLFRIPGLHKEGANCTETVSEGVITLTDTDDNPDVWDSKALFDSGFVLEPGKEYTATFTLSGDNGVGEFFFLKNDKIGGDRYNFADTAGTHTITFTADSAALFFGIQCGNIGNGNSMSVSGLTVTPVELEEASEGTDQEADTSDGMELPGEPAPEAEPAEEEETPAEPEAAAPSDEVEVVADETEPAPEAQPEEVPAAPAEEIPEADAVSENEGE